MAIQFGDSTSQSSAAKVVKVFTKTGKQTATRNLLNTQTATNIRMGSDKPNSTTINGYNKIWDQAYTPTNSSGTAKIDVLLNSVAEDNNYSDYHAAGLVAKISGAWYLLDWYYFGNGSIDRGHLLSSWGTVNDWYDHVVLHGICNLNGLTNIAIILFSDASGTMAMNDVKNDTSTYTTMTYTSYIQVTEQI